MTVSKEHCQWTIIKRSQHLHGANIQYKFFQHSILALQDAIRGKDYDSTMVQTRCIIIADNRIWHQTFTTPTPTMHFVSMYTNPL